MIMNTREIEGPLLKRECGDKIKISRKEDHVTFECYVDHLLTWCLHDLKDQYCLHFPVICLLTKLV